MISISSKESRLLIFTSVSHAISDGWYFLYPSLLFLMAPQYDNDFVFLGLLANIFLVATGISGTFAGLLSDIFRMRVLFAAFSVLCCLGCLLVFYSSDKISISLGLFLLGAGNGIYHPVGLASITRHIRNSANGLGIHGLNGSIGGSIVPVLAISIGFAYGWKTPFALAAIVSILVLLILPLIPEDFDRPILNKSALISKLMVSKLVDKHMLVLYCIVLFREFARIGFLFFLATALLSYSVLGKDHILGVSYAGFFVSFVVASGGVGAFIGGKVARFISYERMLFLICLAAVPLLLGFGFAGGVSILILAPLISFLFNAGDPLVGGLLGKYLPTAMHGQGFAILHAGTHVIGSLVGLLGGVIAYYYGVSWVFTVMGMFLLFAVVVNRVLLWSDDRTKMVST